MERINYFYEDTTFELREKERISSWVIHTVESEGKQVEGINYIFCSDEYLLEINKDHLQHDYYTDIITFDNTEEGGHIESDIFISIDRVADNAEDQGIAFEEELRRVVIHGVLHLIGYKDKSDTEKEIMRAKENAYLSLSKFITR